MAASRTVDDRPAGAFDARLLPAARRACAHRIRGGPRARRPQLHHAARRRAPGRAHHLRDVGLVPDGRRRASSTSSRCPTRAGPEGLPSELDQRIALGDRLPERWRVKGLVPHGIEYRRVEPDDLLAPAPRPSESAIWMRAHRAAAGRPDRASRLAGLRVRPRPAARRHAAARPELHERQGAAREPRPRDVVPPRFPHGRLAALQHRFAERERRARPVPRQHLHARRPAGRLDRAGRHAARPARGEPLDQRRRAAPI